MLGEIDLMKNRPMIEARFVFCLYKNPLELYDEYKIDEAKDLLTADGKFYYRLGEILKDKGLRVLDALSIETYLEDFPMIKQEYDNKGGYNSIKDFLEDIQEENIEGYYKELCKSNTLIRLREKGFLVDEKVANLQTEDDILNYYEAVLNTVSLNVTHSLNLEKLDFTEQEIIDKKKGLALGYQFNESTPLLNSFCGGIPKSGMTVFGSYSNGGKTSFIFNSIIMPLVKNGIKVALISNEQNVDVFKDLIMMYVLTHELNCYTITRNKLKTLKLTDEEEETFKEARKIISEKYSNNISFQRIFNYDALSIKKIIKKLAKQGFGVFIYDTLKVSDNVKDNAWLDLLQSSKTLFQIASKENVSIICSLQLSLSTKNHVRYLDDSCFSNSKQIIEVLEEAFLWRDLFSDEYTGEPNDCRPYNYKKVDGKYVKEREQITISKDDGKKYKIFFHSKSRGGDNGQTVLMEFVPAWNVWKEIGYCTVSDINKV